ncbi:uncharacterized protein LOC113546057 [Pangasianodon hypophthalmus]|uniref:uncharacterized protein LOC113546057 n=1 Tax=Pangasianodon hypophthalmus TaxID=310915 RepID=UPI002307CDF4|nr:uncharacterized protein LOC113546057 [Pangasianodon hypophthalmus]
MCSSAISSDLAESSSTGLGLKVNISAANGSCVCAPVLAHVRGRLIINYMSKNEDEHMDREALLLQDGNCSLLRQFRKPESVVMNIKNISEETSEPQKSLISVHPSDGRIDISAFDGKSVFAPVIYSSTGTLTINYFVITKFTNISEIKTEPQAQVIVPLRRTSSPYSPSELRINISAFNESSVFAPVFYNFTGTVTINYFSCNEHQ